jgi:hypothetical protein
MDLLAHLIPLRLFVGHARSFISRHVTLTILNMIVGMMKMVSFAGLSIKKVKTMNHPYEIVEVEDDEWAFYTDKDEWSMDLLGSYDSKDRCGVWPSYEEADEAAQDHWRGID